MFHLNETKRSSIDYSTFFSKKHQLTKLMSIRSEPPKPCVEVDARSIASASNKACKDSNLAYSNSRVTMSTSRPDITPTSVFSNSNIDLYDQSIATVDQSPSPFASPIDVDPMPRLTDSPVAYSVRLDNSSIADAPRSLVNFFSQEVLLIMDRATMYTSIDKSLRLHWEST